MRCLLLFLMTLAFSIPANAQETNFLSGSKLSPSLYGMLRSGSFGKKERDSIDIVIAVTDMQPFRRDQQFARVIKAHASSRTIIVRTVVPALPHLIMDSSVLFMDRLRKPKEELTTGAVDYSLNNIRFMQHQFPSMNGDSIVASVKEQAFDTADIDFKGRVLHTGTASSTSSIHASIMSTILAGGGNSSPDAKGGAWGACLSSSDFASLLPDEDSVYRQYEISVQNHSYGTGIENYYGADAAAYDRTVWTMPQLVHVFSAGNEGISADSTGTYAGIEGFANLTGSFKMAKNVLTVGHVDSFNQVLPLSSRGPAYDGRIKPELVAFGEDGSSGAAAMVSGVVAVLQQAYKRDETSYPSAHLIKAVLLNSAHDIGTKGIDYASGFGSLDVYNALKTIEENRFLEGSVTNNQLKTFVITVPQNASQLKISMAWTDTTAIANAGKALVNDLDLRLRSMTTNEVWLPWSLNTAPDKDSLLLPAVRKKDTLNTIEQIVVENPTAGEYIIEVEGSKIITLSQSFAIAYQVDTLQHFLWTYPSGSDVLEAGKENILRWQSNVPDAGTIEYSIDGNTWQIISSNADFKKQYLKWKTPDTISTARLRMRIHNGEHVSDTFVISRPLHLNVGFNCADSFLLFWDKLPVADYQLYAMGKKYMEPVRIVPDSFSVFQKAGDSPLYFSVAPNIGNKKGTRSITIDYTAQGVGCYIKTFFASFQNSAAVLEANLGTTYNIASIAFQKITSSDTQTLKTIASPPAASLSYTDVSLTRGINSYRIAITLNNGAVLYSDIEDVNYFPSLPVLIFPNPARQSEPVRIVVADPFVYSLQVYDAVGRLVLTQSLEDIRNQIQPLILQKGIYFIKITDADGKLGVQKLIVQ
jgi:hypothetical protein